MHRRTIGLCHGNRLFCECLAASLSGFDDFMCHALPPESIVSSANTSLAGLGCIELLLLDMGKSQDLSIRVFEEVRTSYPECKVLLLISEQAADRMIELARMGGHGCLFDDVSLNDVRDAISTVLAGRSFCSPQLANSLLVQIGRVDHNESWSQHLDGVQLTSREREVLGLISRERLCNKQVARRLTVSLYTIKNHVHNIIAKLGAQDRYDAVEIARRRKLLTGDRSLAASGAFS